MAQTASGDQSATTAQSLTGLGSALGGPIGGALGAIGGQLLSFALNASAASKAHDRQKNMITRGPTYIMQGLREAGINPILAAGSAGLMGSAAKVSMAAPARGGDIPKASLVGKQGRLLDAQTTQALTASAKQVAETGITAAGQPAADWWARFSATPEGERLMEMKRIHEAMPQTIGAGAARGVYQIWGKGQRDYDPNSGRWPSRIIPPKNYQQEDNRR